MERRIKPSSRRSLRRCIRALSGGIQCRGLYFAGVFAAASLSALSASTEQAGSGAPAAPGGVPPNASRVTAVVVAHKVWPPGSLTNVRPLVSPTDTFHSVDLKILTSEFGVPNLSHLAPVGQTLSVFSGKTIPDDIVGKKIEANITLTGSTEGTRWMLQSFALLR